MWHFYCIFTGRKVSVLLVAFAYLFPLHWKLCVMKRTQPVISEIQRAEFLRTTIDGLYTNIFISMYNQSCLTIRHVPLYSLVNGIAFNKINYFFDHFRYKRKRGIIILRLLYWRQYIFINTSSLVQTHRCFQF